MKKLKEFVRFDDKKFMNGKTFVFKDAKPYSADNGEQGYKFDLLIEKDNTEYTNPEDKYINELEVMTIKMPNATQDYVQMFKRRSPVNVEIIKTTPYVKTVGNFSTIEVSFKGNVKLINRQ